MNTMRTNLLLVSLLASSAACALPASTYVPVAVNLGLSDADALAELAAFVADNQWTVVGTSEGGRVLEVLAPVEVVADTLLRERWAFAVHGGELLVRRVLEVRFDAESGWTSSSEVCATYEYAREHIEIARLRERLASRRLTGALSLR
jgi:hypothetical protein